MILNINETSPFLPDIKCQGLSPSPVTRRGEQKGWGQKGVLKTNAHFN